MSSFQPKPYCVGDRERSSTGQRTYPDSILGSECFSSDPVDDPDPDADLLMVNPNALQDQDSLAVDNGVLHVREWLMPVPEYPDAPKRCHVHWRSVVDALLVLSLGVALCVGAYWSGNHSLPFVYAVLFAIALLEWTWLAYRLRQNVYLPFKLHQSQTTREMYHQIMQYSVNLDTCVISSAAERLACGHQRIAATVLATVFSSLSIAALTAITRWKVEVVAFVGTVVFCGTIVMALAPNGRDAMIAGLLYASYALSTASVLVVPVKQAPRPALVDSFHLLLLCAVFMLIARSLTVRDAMESMIMVLMDMAALVYLAGAAHVVTAMTALTNVAGPDGPHRMLVFDIFVISLGTEFGGYIVEHALRGLRCSFLHALAPHISSWHSYEQLVGALLLGVGISALLVFKQPNFPIPWGVFLGSSACAIVCAHIGKLWLISLKKAAKVNHSGEYLTIGGGVIDRIDSLLLMNIVFTVVLRKSLT